MREIPESVRVFAEHISSNFETLFDKPLPFALTDADKKISIEFVEEPKPGMSGTISTKKNTKNPLIIAFNKKIFDKWHPNPHADFIYSMVIWAFTNNCRHQEKEIDKATLIYCAQEKKSIKNILLGWNILFQHSPSDLNIDRMKEMMDLARQLKTR